MQSGCFPADSIASHLCTGTGGWKGHPWGGIGALQGSQVARGVDAAAVRALRGPGDAHWRACLPGPPARFPPCSLLLTQPECKNSAPLKRYFA